MAAQDWSIMIVSSKGSIAFQPDVPGDHPGDPLKAGDADLISWNNRTGDAHWPWALDPSTGEPFETAADAEAASLYLCDNVDAWQSSSPAYLTTAPSTGYTVIRYVCRHHENEHGMIIVSASSL
jgi:hypothetical protein